MDNDVIMRFDLQADSRTVTNNQPSMVMLLIGLSKCLDVSVVHRVTKSPYLIVPLVDDEPR